MNETETRALCRRELTAHGKLERSVLLSEQRVLTM